MSGSSGMTSQHASLSLPFATPAPGPTDMLSISNTFRLGFGSIFHLALRTYGRTDRRNQRKAQNVLRVRKHAIPLPGGRSVDPDRSRRADFGPAEDA